MAAETNSLIFLWAAYAVMFGANIAYVSWLVVRWKRAGRTDL